jgi:hypothetical protein
MWSVEDQTGTDTHVLPRGNYVIVNPSRWGNFMIADTCGPILGILTSKNADPRHPQCLAGLVQSQPDAELLATDLATMIKKR